MLTCHTFGDHALVQPLHVALFSVSKPDVKEMIDANVVVFQILVSQTYSVLKAQKGFTFGYSNQKRIQKAGWKKIWDSGMRYTERFQEKKDRKGNNVQHLMNEKE